jgi:hypothetical protein
MTVGGISHLSNIYIIPSSFSANLTESRRLSNGHLPSSSANLAVREIFDEVCHRPDKIRSLTLTHLLQYTDHIGGSAPSTRFLERGIIFSVHSS